jgi:hypothetical protein
MGGKIDKLSYEKAEPIIELYVGDPEKLITRADVALRLNTCTPIVTRVLGSHEYLEIYAKKRRMSLKKLQEQISEKTKRIKARTKDYFYKRRY